MWMEKERAQVALLKGLPGGGQVLSGWTLLTQWRQGRRNQRRRGTRMMRDELNGVVD